jgi:hypothetical protein
MITWSVQESSSVFQLSCSADGDGDYFASLEVAVDGFADRAGGHIAGRDWIMFVDALRQLERTRKGEASFASAAQGEFELSVHSIDSKGHMGLSGLLGAGGSNWPNQQLRFSCKFDPSKLSELLRSIDSS